MTVQLGWRGSVCIQVIGAKVSGRLSSKLSSTQQYSGEDTRFGATAEPTIRHLYPHWQLADTKKSASFENIGTNRISFYGKNSSVDGIGPATGILCPCCGDLYSSYWTRFRTLGNDWVATWPYRSDPASSGHVGGLRSYKLSSAKRSTSCC